MSNYIENIFSNFQFGFKQGFSAQYCPFHQPIQIFCSLPHLYTVLFIFDHNVNFASYTYDNTSYVISPFKRQPHKLSSTPNCCLPQILLGPFLNTLHNTLNTSNTITTEGEWVKHTVINAHKLRFSLTDFMPLVFLYPLKTSENQRFSDVFMGCRKRLVVWNGLKFSLVNVNKPTLSCGYSHFH